jgi:hypothetical protein
VLISVQGPPARNKKRRQQLVGLGSWHWLQRPLGGQPRAGPHAAQPQRVVDILRREERVGNQGDAREQGDFNSFSKFYLSVACK